MKILFVCTGNICRSPLAEGILSNKFKEKGLDIRVDSCGFESFHTGDLPDPRAIKEAAMNGIDISQHASRLFRTEDFDLSDRIYVMDSSHYHKVMRLARNEQDRQKVDYIMNVVYPGKNIPVPDPWYDDPPAFKKVFDLLEPACEKIASDLQHSKPARER